MLSGVIDMPDKAKENKAKSSKGFFDLMKDAADDFTSILAGPGRVKGIPNAREKNFMNQRKGLVGIGMALGEYGSQLASSESLPGLVGNIFGGAIRAAFKIVGHTLGMAFDAVKIGLVSIPMLAVRTVGLAAARIKDSRAAQAAPAAADAATTAPAAATAPPLKPPKPPKPAATAATTAPPPPPSTPPPPVPSEFTQTPLYTNHNGGLAGQIGKKFEEDKNLAAAAAPTSKIEVEAMSPLTDQKQNHSNQNFETLESYNAEQVQDPNTEPMADSREKHRP